jgi:hypothetical protein
MPEVLLRSDVDRQVALPLASGGVLRYVWESRFGTILIEVAGEDVFVNGQRVERHARPAMHSVEPSASLGQNSRRENPSSIMRYGKMPYP